MNYNYTHYISYLKVFRSASCEKAYEAILNKDNLKDTIYTRQHCCQQHEATSTAVWLP